MHFPDTYTDTVTQLLFPRECRTLVSLKTAIPRIPAACPAPLVHTAPLQAYLGSLCSQPKLPLWRKPVKCLQQSGCAGRDALTQDPSTFINSALGLIIHLAPANSRPWRNVLESKGPWGQGIQKGRKVWKVGCWHWVPSGVKYQHGDPMTEEGTRDHHVLPSLGQDEFGACQTRGAREGNGTPLQCSCLENSMDGGAWWAAVHGVSKSRTWLSNFTFTFHFPALEKEMATHSGVLAWRIPGTGEPGGLPSMGSHRVGHNWSDLANQRCTCSQSLKGQCVAWQVLCRVMESGPRQTLFRFHHRHSAPPRDAHRSRSVNRGSPSVDCRLCSPSPQQHLKSNQLTRICTLKPATH